MRLAEKRKDVASTREQRLLSKGEPSFGTPAAYHWGLDEMVIDDTP
jgi:hypothetical protein